MADRAVDWVEIRADWSNFQDLELFDQVMNW